jgi:hypothetical protein
MERDKHLINMILTEVEKKTNYYPNIISVEGYDLKLVNYHIGLLAQAGFLHAINQGHEDNPKWSVYGLTWQGHDLLDEIRKDYHWK